MGILKRISDNFGNSAIFLILFIVLSLPSQISAQTLSDSSGGDVPIIFEVPVRTSFTSNPGGAAPNGTFTAPDLSTGASVANAEILSLGVTTNSQNGYSISMAASQDGGSFISSTGIILTSDLDTSAEMPITITAGGTEISPSNPYSTTSSTGGSESIIPIVLNIASTTGGVAYVSGNYSVTLTFTISDNSN